VAWWSPAITQLQFLSCAQAPSRPEGPAGRGGGAKRSALYGAEHSATLSHVMATSSVAYELTQKPAHLAFLQRM
jgi:hypothetical protein